MCLTTVLGMVSPEAHKSVDVASNSVFENAYETIRFRDFRDDLADGSAKTKAYAAV